jgi:AraC family transcriptional regulator
VVPVSDDLLIAPSVSSGSYVFADVTPSRRGALRIALVGRELCGPSYVVQRSSYPFPTFEFVAEGNGLLRRRDGPEQVLGPGSLFAYSPEMSHVISSGGGRMVKYFVSLNGRGAWRYLTSVTPSIEGPCVLHRHNELRELFDLIIREGQEQVEGRDVICLKLLEVLLLKVSKALGREGHTSSKARDRFLQCKAYIDENASTIRSLDEVSQSLQIDPSNLSRLFRRYQGSSPYQYLLRCKMNLAAGDFIRSGALVKEVASRLGYEDPYHFSRLFKMVHGIPPAKFRALNV